MNGKKEYKETAKKLAAYIKESPTAYHAVAAGIKRLEAAGFAEWSPLASETVKPGAKFWYSPYPTCLFAFVIGTKEGMLKLAGAHTDSPCFHIKPNPDCPQQLYLRLNTDIYGGPIHNSWLDRPLSIAGSVALRDGENAVPKLELVDLKAPVLTIPNLAIHMNRDANKGHEWNPQTELLPLLGMKDEKDKDAGFVKFLAKKLKVKAEDILDFDLFVYNTEDALFQGMNEEFLSAPRLDNLTSCFALIEAMTKLEDADGINVIALYDNEEIGSLTARGADSRTLPMLLENIYEALGKSRSEMNADILAGTLLSVDVAHALHPNFVGKNDPTNFALMNEGVVFKLNSNQKYINNLETLARLELLCEKEQIPYKKYVNRSDVAGGGTIGNRMASHLPMCGLDMGVPLLAMHSAREMMGVKDQEALERLVREFFRIDNN